MSWTSFNFFLTQAQSWVSLESYFQVTSSFWKNGPFAVDDFKFELFEVQEWCLSGNFQRAEQAEIGKSAKGDPTKAAVQPDVKDKGEMLCLASVVHRLQMWRRSFSGFCELGDNVRENRRLMVYPSFSSRFPAPILAKFYFCSSNL